jgi:hypothetical protein
LTLMYIYNIKFNKILKIHIYLLKNENIGTGRGTPQP